MVLNESCVSAKIISGKCIRFEEAAHIIKIARRYNSSVTIQKEMATASTDSIIMLTRLMIRPYDKVFVTITGDRPDRAMDEIAEFLK